MQQAKATSTDIKFVPRSMLKSALSRVDRQHNRTQQTRPDQTRPDQGSISIILPCPTSAGWVNATARAVANQPMIGVSGINRPAQVSLRPWDFDLGNPGTGSTQYLVFGPSAGEASVNVKTRIQCQQTGRIGLRRLAPCPLHAYVQHCLVQHVLCFISTRTIISTKSVNVALLLL